MIEQTLFGLPWVLTAALLPFSQVSFVSSFLWENWSLWFWILLAFISARTAGMSFNRLIDKEIDLANPRTQNRELPKGHLTPFQVAVVAWNCVFIFIFSCAMINPTCFMLSPIVVILLWAYSYTKRFTPMCHLFLGLIQFFGPVFAWIAVTGSWSISPILLGLALMCSISANDIIYALQDKEFDESYNLYSIPVVLGVKNSFIVAKLLHVMTVFFLVITGISLDLNAVYYVGVALIALIYARHYRHLQENGLQLVNPAFFRCNSYVAITLLFFSAGAVACTVLL
jgi:4-hydroxybenzoate polyprenyltransferase